MTFSPRTWSVGEIVTADQLNTEIRDQFNSMFAAWTVYTPTWTCTTGTAPAIGNGVLSGRSLKVGRTVDLLINLIAGSTTTYGSGGFFQFSLPYPAANLGNSSFAWSGSAMATDTGTAYYPGVSRIFSSGTTIMALSPGTATGSTPTEWSNIRPPAAWTATDRMALQIRYETAT